MQMRQGWIERNIRDELDSSRRFSVILGRHCRGHGRRQLVMIISACSLDEQNQSLFFDRQPIAGRRQAAC
jgi:hypothetical protein